MQSLGKKPGNQGLLFPARKTWFVVLPAGQTRYQDNISDPQKSFEKVSVTA